MLPLLDEKAQTVVFANIEDILLFNTSFFSSLEDRQKACRLYVDQIGDILERNAAGMEVYEAYCVNQQNGERVLRGLRGSNEALEAHLKVRPPYRAYPFGGSRHMLNDQEYTRYESGSSRSGSIQLPPHSE